MKKITFLLLLILFSHLSVAQENQKSLEKGLASIDVGLLGSWVTYEVPVAKQLTVISQIGLEAGFFKNIREEGFNYIFTPSITLEPRFYYNFNKRERRDKKVINNSADYFAFYANYIPGLFSISNEDVEAAHQLYLIPMWGLRRTIGERVKFEFAVGYGLAIVENETYGEIGLNLKLGYFFYRK